MDDELELIGTTIDERYLIEACVGAGGFAVVYRAMHLAWQKPVAIKVFRALASAPAEAQAKLFTEFRQEGALLRELSTRTASIVQAHDFGTLVTKANVSMPYMVLEWLDGQSLEDILEQHRGKRWSLDMAMALLEPIAMALDVAHRRNISHRDIKPANVYVYPATLTPEDAAAPEDLRVKLLDFGIAKVVESAPQNRMTGTAHYTAFTPAYGAPEQFSRTRGATGPWTDVYALALVLVEMLTGDAALLGEDFLELGMASSDERYRPTPRRHGVSITDQVEAVFLRALAVNPGERFASAGTFWDALRTAQRMETDTRAQLSVALTSPVTSRRSAYVRTTPITGAPLTSTSEPITPRRSRRALVVAAAAIVAAVAAVAVGMSSFSAERHVKLSVAPGPGTSVATLPSASPLTPPKAPACPAGMVRVGPGQFFMGSELGSAEEDEKPVHHVLLSAYCMDIHEVTVRDYLACSSRGACRVAPSEIDLPTEALTAAQRREYSLACNIREAEARGEHPINCIDWEMARQYCHAQGKRLPTEAEWEFAARGPDGRTYPWGNDAPSHAHLNACGAECAAWHKERSLPLWASKVMYPTRDAFPTTAPVGSFPLGASVYGLQDIVGNVWEWTSDFHGRYTQSEVTDPTGPEAGVKRVVRGGGWNGQDPAWVRPSYRYSFQPGTRSHVVGVRCAQSVEVKAP